jgi:nitric oxide reductase NorD protein
MADREEKGQSYALLASAVAGRTIAVHWHQQTRYGVYTDNFSIFVPSVGSERSYQLDIIAQALLIRGESLSQVKALKLLGREQLARRYLQAEIARLSREFESILPRSFTGSVDIKDFNFPLTSSKDSYDLAVSGCAMPEPPSFIGSLRGLSMLRASWRSSQSQSLSDNERSHKEHSAEINRLTEEEKSTSQESKLLKFFENPLVSSETLGNFLRNLLGGGLSGESDDNAGKSPASGGPLLGEVRELRHKGRFSSFVDFALGRSESQFAGNSGANQPYLYPEWNYVSRSYRDRWVEVEEVDPWREVPDSERHLHQLLSPPSRQLKRNLAGVGLGFESHFNQQAGEDFELDRVVEYFVDWNMGSTPSNNLYINNLKTRRDLGVMVLLDISASTAESEPGQNSVHYQQMRLAYHLVRALHELGDYVALYAYQSWGRSQVRMLRVKSFDERVLGSQIEERLARLEPEGYTRTGAALRHADKILSKNCRLPYRLLVVITDGFAYDREYEGKYGEQDTRKALEEIRGGGAGCLCLTIGSDREEEKLQEIFGHAATLSVSSYEDFVSNIRPAFVAAVAQAIRPPR